VTQFAVRSSQFAVCEQLLCHLAEAAVPWYNGRMVAPEALRPLIQLRQVIKVYPMGQRMYTALRGVDLTFYAGEFTAIVGHSGSGKTTILNMITGIDRPTSGEVVVGGRPIHKLSENALA